MLIFLLKAQHAMKKPHQALKTVNKAIQSMPKNALCKYHKASFLYTLERYDVSIFYRISYYLQRTFTFLVLLKLYQSWLCDLMTSVK